VPALAVVAADAIPDEDQLPRETHAFPFIDIGDRAVTSSASEAAISARVQRRPDRPISTKSSWRSVCNRGTFRRVAKVMSSSSAARTVSLCRSEEVLQSARRTIRLRFSWRAGIHRSRGG
jgi:hypothetical protein